MSEESDRDSEARSESQKQAEEATKWWREEQLKLAMERDRRFGQNANGLNAALCMTCIYGRIIFFADSYNSMVLEAMADMALDGVRHFLERREAELARAKLEMMQGNSSIN